MITKIQPNFALLSAKHIDPDNESETLDKLSEMTSTVASVRGQSILQKVDQKKIDVLARAVKFDFVEGSYYRAIAFDYLGKLDKKAISI